jgi:hypothetical protein
MNVLCGKRTPRPMAGALIILLTALWGQEAVCQQQAVPDGQQQSAPVQQTQAASAQSTNPNPQAGAAPAVTDGQEPAPQQQQPASQQSDSQQTNGTAPLGTAAAPAEKTTGVAASQPAGAAIAPGKQRRVRSFLVKGAIVIGAAVAVGTVVALSRSNSGRPN